MSKTILFFGNERLATGVTSGAPALRSLIEAGYHIPAIIIAQNPQDKSRRARRLEIEEMAIAHGIEVLSPADLKRAKTHLSQYRARAAVLVAYGKLVPQSIIDLFPRGIINIHPSLLPLHRGPTPVESVMLNGEKETGVSLMQLSEAMDAGPIYAQRSVELSGQETKQELADRLGNIGAKMLVKYLPDILSGDLDPRPQDEHEATHDLRIEKADGVLDWQKPALRLAREVRAYAGWPRSRTQIGFNKVIVTAAHSAAGDGAPGSLWIQNRQLGVYAGQGVLIIDRLIPAGKKEMSAEAFLAGYKTS